MQRCVDWINKLSLDAPVVGLLWMLLFCDEHSVTPSPALAGVLFGSIWIVYVLDRILEKQPKRILGRHLFHKKHKILFLTFSTVVVFINILLLGFAKLGLQTYLSGAIIASCSFLYILVAGKLPVSKSSEQIKNLFVAIIFASGVAFPVWGIHPFNFVHIAALLWQLLSLAILIYCNLRLTESSEQNLSLSKTEVLVPGVLLLTLFLINPSKLMLTWILSYFAMLGVWMIPKRNRPQIYDLVLIFIAAIALKY